MAEEVSPTRQRFYIAAAVVTLLIAIFDMATDWWMFKDFCLYQGGKLTPALGIFCVIATILFVLEVRNCIWQIRFYRVSKDDTTHEAVELDLIEKQTAANVLFPHVPTEKKLAHWKETVSFLLLALEDFPVTVIMYVAFKTADCELFIRIFEESFTANLALMAAFISSLWKGLQSFFYCCSCCSFPDVHGCCGHFCCCCCRGFRPLVAILLCGFAAYLYFTFNNEGVAARPECLAERDVTTAAGGV